MKKAMRKKIVILMAVACCFAAIGVATAFFSDYDSNIDNPLVVKVDEDSIKIEPTDPGVTPEYPDDPGKEIEHIWELKNDADPDVIAPGDSKDLSYTLNNVGNCAIDVRETFILTSTEALDQTNPEFRLFLDATEDKYGATIGGTVVSKEEISPKSIKYTVAPFVLSSEEETIEGAATSKELTYIFVFDKYATNEFQADKCVIDYIIEVKQHTDDGSEGGWAEVADVTLTFGEQTLKVVPEA